MLCGFEPNLLPAAFRPFLEPFCTFSPMLAMLKSGKIIFSVNTHVYIIFASSVGKLDLVSRFLTKITARTMLLAAYSTRSDADYKRRLSMCARSAHVYERKRRAIACLTIASVRYR